MKKIKDILLDILTVASPSENEQMLTKKLSDYMAPIVDKVTIDSIGNAIAFKKGMGSGKRIMIFQCSTGLFPRESFLRFESIVFGNV